ncbi:hypothetical protein KOR42_16700 [Thalassoglobus neptunius]|uniref:Uncharacterized protein n=1 Tax=Thalassoglobus neptunius TaxID=1938619 RepID=A0A5C5X5J2_9PLAN|nr:hypothetical protein [Thalassoglobus neptunius]TWT58296.1 hypothetical protein KOR42_16700 [Thalassoglobus neptunius]
MKRVFLFPSLVGALICCTFAINLTANSKQAGSPDLSNSEDSTKNDLTQDAPLIVHEWGTFTSFSGSDGIHLSFRPLVENDLPKFVSTIRPSWSRLLSKQSIRAIQRMETPITYFYTDVERDVEVQVEFPQGLLTEYFPPVRQFHPEMPYISPTPFGQGLDPKIPLENGKLDWGKIHLIPAQSLRPAVKDEELSRRIGHGVEKMLMEPEQKYPHYFAARNTDSAIVQFRTGEAPNSIDYFEKFLFYRGVGNFQLPVTAEALADGTFTLKNSGDEDLRSVFLVEVKNQSVRFRKFDRVEAQSHTTLTHSADWSDIQPLVTEMVSALVQEGLYEKEAESMVECWKSSWFGEEGTRILYMVPTHITETLLPLQVTPKPDEVVRVLVGRMEIMPQETEQRVLDLVTKSAQARTHAAQNKTEFKSPALDSLVEMGRLAEPALIRISALAKDPLIQSEVAQLIRELRTPSDQQITDVENPWQNISDLAGIDAWTGN